MNLVAHRRTHSYAEQIEGAARNQFADAIRRGFNAIGRAHIQSGHSVIPVMFNDGSIQNCKVIRKDEEFAMLESESGDTYGVDLCAS